MTAPPRIVDLSHPVVTGMDPYPGLPSPRIEPHISHAASHSAYGGQAAFEITRYHLVGNTATSLDAPSHRHPGHADLAALPLSSLASLPGVVIDLDGRGAGPAAPELPGAIDGHAVLFRTGWDKRWGTPRYWRRAPFVPRALAEHLVAVGVALVGTDAWNIDDVGDPARPAHTVLLAAGIPIVEHLRDLGGLPSRGFRFTAVPPPMRGGTSFPVRAFAELPPGETDPDGIATESWRDGGI